MRAQIGEAGDQQVIPNRSFVLEPIKKRFQFEHAIILFVFREATTRELRMYFSLHSPLWKCVIKVLVTPFPSFLYGNTEQQRNSCKITNWRETNLWYLPSLLLKMTKRALYLHTCLSASRLLWSRNLVCRTGFFIGRGNISQHPSLLKTDVSICMAALHRFDSSPFKTSLTFGLSS